MVCPMPLKVTSALAWNLTGKEEGATRVLGYMHGICLLILPRLQEGTRRIKARAGLFSWHSAA